MTPFCSNSLGLVGQCRACQCEEPVVCFFGPRHIRDPGQRTLVNSGTDAACCESGFARGTHQSFLALDWSVFLALFHDISKNARGYAP